MLTDRKTAVKENLNQVPAVAKAATKRQAKIVLCTKEDHIVTDLAREAAMYIMPFDIPEDGLLLTIESAKQTRERIKRFKTVLDVVTIEFQNHDKAVRLLNSEPLHHLAGEFGLELDDWNGKKFRLFAAGEGYRVSFK